MPARPKIEFYGSLVVIMSDPDEIRRSNETWAAVPVWETERAGKKVRTVFGNLKSEKDFPESLRTIASLGWAAGPKLKEILDAKESPWRKRYLAAISLGRIGGVEAKKALLIGLNDGLSVIRMACIIALEHFPDRDVITALHRIFLNDKGMLVRNTAVESLAEIGDPTSIDVLASGLGSEANFYKGRNLWIRNNIVKALGRFKNKGSIPYLIGILQSKDEALTLDALHSLELTMSDSSLSFVSSKENLSKRVAWWIGWWEKNKSDYM